MYVILYYPSQIRDKGPSTFPTLDNTGHQYKFSSVPTIKGIFSRVEDWRSFPGNISYDVRRAGYLGMYENGFEQEYE